jgi:hypothetical protein
MHRFKKLIHGFSFLTIISFFILKASEKTPFSYLPHEINTYIFKEALFKNESNCPIFSCEQNNNGDKMYIPYTLLPTGLKSNIPIYYAYFFHTQLTTIVNKEDNTLQLNLCNHLDKQVPFILSVHVQNSLYGTSFLDFFDGINEKGIGIIGRYEFGKYFYLYCLDIYAKNAGKSNVPNLSHLFTRKHLIKPLYSYKAGITSLMLHPEKNTIAFSTTRAEKIELPHCFTIADIRENCLENIKAIDLPNLVNIKKTIYLGKQTYLALTHYYRLVILWQELDGTINYRMQKHASAFIDIAVDNTTQTEKGFKPYVLCLNNKYELFVTDLLAFSQPVLFFLKAIPNPINNMSNYFYRLFYDNKQCIVIYKNINNSKYTKALICHDNLGALYTKKIMKLNNQS